MIVVDENGDRGFVADGGEQFTQRERAARDHVEEIAGFRFAAEGAREPRVDRKQRGYDVGVDSRCAGEPRQRVDERDEKGEGNRPLTGKGTRDDRALAVKSEAPLEVIDQTRLAESWRRPE